MQHDTSLHPQLGWWLLTLFLKNLRVLEKLIFQYLDSEPSPLAKKPDR